MKKYISAIAATLLGLSLLAGPVAGSNDKVTICHAAGRAGTTHYVTLTISENAVYGPGGHFNENGTTQAGHEQDYLGPCQDQPSPTPTAQPTPSATPTPEPTPSPSPTSTPEPTPTATPSPSSTPTASPSESTQPTSTPSETPTPNEPRLTPNCEGVTFEGTAPSYNLFIYDETGLVVAQETEDGFIPLPSGYYVWAFGNVGPMLYMGDFTIEECPVSEPTPTIDDTPAPRSLATLPPSDTESELDNVRTLDNFLLAFAVISGAVAFAGLMLHLSSRQRR